MYHDGKPLLLYYGVRETLVFSFGERGNRQTPFKQQYDVNRPYSYVSEVFVVLVRNVVWICYEKVNN